VSKRAWLVFTTIQAVGCILAGYGTVYSESAFVRWSWLIGFLLLLPGNLAAMALDPMLVHVRSAYVFFPVTIVSNAIAWTTCSAAWWTIRCRTAKNTVPPMRPSLKITSIVGIVVLLGVAAITMRRHRQAVAVSQLYSSTISILKGAPRIPMSTLRQLTLADFTVVRDLRYVPVAVKESFCNIEECDYVGSKFDMVNPGETMSTDYILPGVPNKRLVFAALNKDSAVIVYERGGYANFLRATILDFRGGRSWDSTLNRYSVKNLQDLRVALAQEESTSGDGK